MQHLTTVQGTFHARVVAARLGAEGILVELRGEHDGPYPLPGPVELYVDHRQLALAREVLLADAVDAAVDDDAVEAELFGDGEGLEAAGRADNGEDRAAPGRAGDRHLALVVVALSVLVVVALLAGLLALVV